MQGQRCTQCGDVRWTMLGRPAAEGRCELCGGPTRPERRRPGRDRRQDDESARTERRVAVDRRDVAPLTGS